MATLYTLPGRPIADIPVIETPRLRLRAHRIEDYDRMFSMWQDPAYYKFIGNRARSSGEVWMTLQRGIGSWALFGLGYWTIADKDTDQHIGEGGFALNKRAEIDPPMPMVPEIGWGIRSEYWGKGLSKEAMRAAVDWGLSQDPGFPYQCIISQGHTASESVARSLSMTTLRSVAYNGDANDMTNVWVRTSLTD